jgi:hypothetical protein
LGPPPRRGPNPIRSHHLARARHAAAPPPAPAPDPGLSVARIVLDAREVQVRVDLDVADAAGVSLDAGALALAFDGRPQRPARRLPIAGDPAGAAVGFAYDDAPRARLEVHAALLASLPPGHRQVLRVERAGGALVAEAMLSAQAPALAIDLASGEPAPPRRLARFFVAGAGHVLAGADHLLFLGLVLLGCRGLGAVARVVSAFTAAHAIALGAVALGALPGDAAWVEPAIAASIVYAAGVNALAPAREGRAAIAFAFGLVHGLGLASALAALPLGDGIALLGAIASFHLGVESVQLAIAALLLPLLAAVARTPAAARRVVLAGSALAAAVGLVWLVARTLAIGA